jgi:transcriptional regulator with XRE-family HTH domain
MKIATNTLTCGAIVPASTAGLVMPPAATFIEPAADECNEPSPDFGNVFSALLPDAARAANDDGFPAGQSGSSKQRKTKNQVFEGRAEMGLRRVVSRRLIAAREASGLGQQEAAREIGYGSPAQLSLWESGRRFPPTSELLKISKLYNTTVSFLLGEAPEMARDPAEGLRVAMLNGVRSQLSRCAGVVVAEISRHARAAGTDSGSTATFIAAGDELLGAVQALIRLNPESFDDLRGGSRVELRLEAFEAALHEARRRQRRAVALDNDLRERLSRLPEGDIDCEALISNDEF